MRALVLFLVVVVACSPVSVPFEEADGGVTVDARAADAGPLPDAEPASGPVSVRVVSHGKPIAGADIVFHDAEGTPIATAKTDADGLASHELVRGGMVTALLTGGFAHTITDVRPGDVLEAIDERRWAAVPPPSKIYGTVPVNPASTLSLLVLTGCAPMTSAAGQLFEIVLEPGCDRSPDGRFPILVLALDGGDAPKGATELILGEWETGPFDVLFEQWNPVTVGSYTVASIPLGIERAVTQLDMLESGVRIPLLEEDRHDDEITNSSVTAATLVAGSAGDAFVDRIQLFGAHDATADMTPYLAFVSHGSAPRAGTLDLGDLTLPLLAPPTVELLDTARPVVGFTPPVDATLDGGWVEWRWTGSEGDARWTVRFPPGASEVRYPALPELFAARRPSTNLGPHAVEHLALVDVGAGGWQEFRRASPPFRLDELVPGPAAAWRISGIRAGD